MIKKIAAFVFAIVMAFLVITRHHELPQAVRVPAQEITVIEPAPKVEPSPLLVDVPALPKPRPLPPEPPRVAVTKENPKTSAAKRVIKAHKPGTVLVKPESGGVAVAVPCGRLRSGIAKVGVAGVKTFAPSYGYSADDVDAAIKACRL